MNKNIRVTVLMPVYNSEDHVLKSIESILNQTYTEFELLIINDGSTDSSKDIILELEDSRINFIENETNMGIIKTLNRGLDLIDSEYILRMDSDDIAHPERLEKQIKFMDTYPDIVVSGTAVNRFTYNVNKTRKRDVPITPSQIRSELFFNTPLLHPTVIMRNEVIKHEHYRYSPKYRHSEDFGLWQEIALKYDLANMKETLLQYKEHEASLTKQADKNIEERDAVHIAIYQDYMNSLGVNLSQEELILWRMFNSGRLSMKDEQLVVALNGVIGKIKTALDWARFDEKTFDSRVSFRFRTSAKNSGITLKNTLTLYKKYMNNFKFDRTEKLKLITKTILNK